MQQYLEMMRHVRDDGTRKEDRTGTGTLATFGYQMRFDLGEGFPLVTTKRLHLKSIIHELLWFLSGDQNTRYLMENGVKIWNEWADEDGNLGPFMACSGVAGVRQMGLPSIRSARSCSSSGRRPIRAALS